jgi:hypothetical protein
MLKPQKFRKVPVLILLTGELKSLNAELLQVYTEFNKTLSQVRKFLGDTTHTYTQTFNYPDMILWKA